MDRKDASPLFEKICHRRFKIPVRSHFKNRSADLTGEKEEGRGHKSGPATRLFERVGRDAAGRPGRYRCKKGLGAKNHVKETSLREKERINYR